jgi:phytoene dehydrogenase-like protein
MKQFLSHQFTPLILNATQSFFKSNISFQHNISNASYDHSLENNHTIRPKAIVIGSGLSGLSTGIKMRQAGMDVKILESKAYAGGLCHTIEQGGAHFEVGCTCFGKGVEKMMEEMGVQHRFKPVYHQLILPQSQIQIPFNLNSFWNLFYPLDLVRLGYNIRYAPEKATLASITANEKIASFQQMIRAMVAYPLFRSPEEISLALAGRFLKNDYGYDQPRVPIGGMSALINSMLERYQTLGGEIDFNSKFKGFSKDAEGRKLIHIINTQTGEESTEKADIIVSSIHGWKQYASHEKPSLKVSSLLLTLDRNKFQYPKGAHTLMFLPSDSTGWLKTHEQGQFASEFGFHCFSNDVMQEVPGKEKPFGLSVYFLTPRGMDQLTQTQQEQSQTYILNTLNQKFPGIMGAIQESHFYSPQDYQKKFGFSSAVAPRIPETQLKRNCYDEKNDMYYIGNAVNSDGEQHAEGAIRSADQVMTAINSQANILSSVPSFNQLI